MLWRFYASMNGSRRGSEIENPYHMEDSNSSALKFQSNEPESTIEGVGIEATRQKSLFPYIPKFSFNYGATKVQVMDNTTPAMHGAKH